MKDFFIDTLNKLKGRDKRIIEWRRNIALKCGVNAVSRTADELSIKTGFNVVIESTGAPEAIASAFKAAKRYGTVILLGSTRGNSEDINFYADVHKKGLTIIGAHESYRAANENFGYFCTNKMDEETVAKLMSDGKIKINPLISDVIPADHAAKAYERLKERKEELMLIVLNWK